LIALDGKTYIFDKGFSEKLNLKGNSIMKKKGKWKCMEKRGENVGLE